MQVVNGQNDAKDRGRHTQQVRAWHGKVRQPGARQGVEIQCDKGDLMIRSKNESATREILQQGKYCTLLQYIPRGKRSIGTVYKGYHLELCGARPSFMLSPAWDDTCKVFLSITTDESALLCWRRAVSKTCQSEKNFDHR